MAASAHIGYQITIILIAFLSYTILDKHLKVKSLSKEVELKLKEIEGRVNDLSFRQLGRK